MKDCHAKATISAIVVSRCRRRRRRSHYCRSNSICVLSKGDKEKKGKSVIIIQFNTAQTYDSYITWQQSQSIRLKIHGYADEMSSDFGSSSLLPIEK